MRNVLNTFLLGGALGLALAACDRASTTLVDPAPGPLVSSGKGVAFGLSSTMRAEVLSRCDSLAATATFGDGSTRTARLALDQAFSKLDQLFHLEALPSDTSSRIEAVFFSKDGKTRYTVTVQISVKVETVQDSSRPQVPETPVTSGNALLLLPVADAPIDPQGYNLGAETSNRLIYKDGMILLDFGDLESLKGRRIVRARLHIRGWSNSADSNMVLAAGTVSRGWTEGTGNWYYFDGAKANDYDLAYANYPGRPFPVGTENPASASGVRWSNAASVVASWTPVCSSAVFLPVGTPGNYPKLANTAPVDFDVTAALRAMLQGGIAKAFAIRFAGGGRGLASTHVSSFSREFGGPEFAPHLEVELGEAVPGADSLELRPVQDVSVDEQGMNMGLGSELRLWRPGSMALLDFGDLSALLAGRSVARAELVLSGWQGLDAPDGQTGRSMEVTLDVGTVGRDWSEGSGHWYWFGDEPRNGFSRAYANWPNYVPPTRARNPAYADGANWENTLGLRSGFRAYARSVVTLPEPAAYAYPSAKASGKVRLDVTEEVRAMAGGDAAALALHRPETGLAAARTPMFFSKDMAPEVAPRLVITFKD